MDFMADLCVQKCFLFLEILMKPDFFVCSFQKHENAAEKIPRAFQILTTTHYSKLAFQSNVRAAFDLLSFHKSKFNVLFRINYDVRAI